MTYAELAAHLARHRVELGLKLTVSAPPGALTEEVKAALAEHKPLIVARVGSAIEREALETWRWGKGEPGPPPF